MNKLFSQFILFCILLSSLSVYGQADYYTYGSRAPTPPGYSISNYFELMPEKVKSINSILPNRLPSKKESFSLKLIRNTLRLSFNTNGGQEQPKISIFTLSGKLVYRATIAQIGSRGAAYVFPLPQLSRGVYFVHVKNKNAQAQIKVVYTGK